MRLVGLAKLITFAGSGLALFVSVASAAILPDGRSVTPVGFTIPVENFASSEALSPDGTQLAVLSQELGAIDIITIGEHTTMSDRLAVPYATGMDWTKDGLYVARGFSGLVSRFTYRIDANGNATFTARPDLKVGGLVNGVAEDPATHRILVARTASRQVDVIDEDNAKVISRLVASGQPFAVGFAGGGIIATLFNSDHVDVWPPAATSARHIFTGPHPTQLLIHGSTAYVANADGDTVSVIDTNSWHVTRNLELGFTFNQAPGQTPSGMAISADGKQLFVAESGFNDVAIVDLSSGKVVARIPTAWYPMSVLFVASSTIDDDPRIKPQLFILSAQGLGQQPDPGSEHDGTYTGLVQHLVVEPRLFASWSATVARNDRFNAPTPPASALPPIKHFVFIVKENKQFDEEFSDVPGANSDPTLLLFGRKYTPNAHALAADYTLFDDFMGNGDRSDFGHSWTTQAWANDYLERSVYTPDDLATTSDPRIAGNIWPVYLYGEDAIPVATMNFDWFQNLAALPRQPRVNVSAVFGPRGELIDEMLQKGISFRVYGEEMTMLPNGTIAAGLAAHADRAYPGAHIDFNVLDTERARLFLADVKAHGLAQYSYLTLPLDHTSGTDPGFYTMATCVSNNDLALGQIIAGLSRRPDWRNTVVFITTDDPQGTGDHVDSHRMPAQMVGPYVRQGYIDHTLYSQVSVLRTVEVLFGLNPLSIYDAATPPMLDAFARQPRVATFNAIPSNIPIARNPGKPVHTSFMLDGPNSAALANEEWAAIKGQASLLAHLAYVRRLGTSQNVASDSDDDAAVMASGAGHHPTQHIRQRILHRQAGGIASAVKLIDTLLGLLPLSALPD